MGQANTKYSDEDKDCVTQTVVELPELFQDGEMREVDVEGSKMLIVKENGKFFALGSNCPCDDTGESLVYGVLFGGRVRCAKHGAVYDLETGDLLEHPGQDSLHAYNLSHEVGDGGRVTVRANKEKLKEDGRVRQSARLFPSDKRTILILGAGAAGTMCAETLRQEGFIGKILIVTSEKHLPYDRTQLSKVSDLPTAEGQQFALRDRKFYSNRDILFKTDKEAIRINAAHSKVIFKDGDEISYYKLLVATGSRARTLLAVPGHDLSNIVTLHSLNDLAPLLIGATSEHVVIVGASFLAVELAESLVNKAKSVTLIDSTEFPLEHTFGKEIGAWIKKMLMQRGVIFHMSSTVKEFEGEHGRLRTVLLTDGTTLEASLCITAIGVEPVTDFLKNSGLVISDKNFLIVDKQMKTNKENVYGAGDVTEFPFFLTNDERANIQHWQMAQQQGRTAALNMLDKPKDIHIVPYITLTVSGQTIRFTGHSEGHDAVVVKGTLDHNASCIAYYTKDDHVVAVASIDRDPIVSQAAELFVARQSLDVADILPDTPEWTTRVNLARVLHDSDTHNNIHAKDNEASTHL